MEPHEQQPFLEPKKAEDTGNKAQQPPTHVSSPYSKKRQVLATVCATLGCLLNGAVIGFTGPAIPSLMNQTDTGGYTIWNSPIKLTPSDASWITGLLSIGCFVGCITAGPVMEKFGRRITLLGFTSSLYFTGFAFILLGENAAMVFLGRFLDGMGLGFVLATTSVYIVEIATSDMRGFLGCFVQFMGSIGVLLIFSTGIALNWFQLSGLMMVMVIPFVLGMIVCPESPRWLFAKGREEEGQEALEWLRGRDDMDTIRKEIEDIKQEITMKKESTVTVRALLEKSVLKPFLISLFMMFFLNMSGMNVMIFYCNSIFYYSRSSISADAGSVIVGVILLASCFVAIVCITRLGRRIILITSMTGMAICYTLLGGCFYVIESAAGKSDLEVEAIFAKFPGWLPPLSILTLLFLGNGGYGTLIWVVTAEMLPPQVRSIGNSIIICFSFVMGFIVSKTFVDLVVGIGASGTFWLYAAFCAAGTIFTIIFVPETKGKTVQEIAQLFK